MATSLTKQGRQQVNEFRQSLAQNHGVDNVVEKFAVEPTVEQELHDKIQESTDFLDKIPLLLVRDIKGEKVFLDIPDPITGRVNTDDEDRKPTSAHALTNKVYELFTTQADVSLKYKDINSWSKFNDFQERWSKAVNKRRAKDRLIIGWNGTHVAEKTDRNTFPLLQDVNIGWLQQLRNNAPQQVLTDGKTPGKITFGVGGDYQSLDEFVYDLFTMIEPERAEGEDLIAIIGSDLLQHEKRVYYKENGRKPQQKEILLNEPRLVGVYGELSAYQVPFFPKRGILVTSLANLAIYIQEESTRKAVKDNDYRSCIDDMLEDNQGYIVQDEEAAAYVEADCVEILV